MKNQFEARLIVVKYPSPHLFQRAALLLLRPPGAGLANRILQDLISAGNYRRQIFIQRLRFWRRTAALAESHDFVNEMTLVKPDGQQIANVHRIVRAV